MLVDYHIHTNHSIDGEMTIDEVCRKAISLGIKEIAFTDHIDLDWPDPEFDFASIDIEQYILEIDQSKAKYKGQLRIKTGIEIGMQPHVVDETTNNKIILDFVIVRYIIQRVLPGNIVGKKESFIGSVQETLE